MTEISVPLDFWLSGQLRVRQGNEVMTLGTTLRNEILALLLLRANTPVAVSEITACVWPDREPVGDEQIWPYISKIRNQLAGTQCRLVTLPRRYQLEVDPMRVDVLRFNLLLDQAERAVEAEQQRLVDEALELCPTDNLIAGFTRAWAHAARGDHRSKWSAAMLRRNRFWLRAGDHDRLLAVLRREKAHQSRDQRLAEDYLVAQYRSGQVPEAIAHYGRLVESLPAAGIPVQRRLQSIGEAIRRQDPSLDQTDTRPSGSTPDLMPPRTAIVEGRHAELQAMRTHADGGGQDSVKVIGIYGSPGIGKTSLATAYAHRHAARYPGGALFAQLGSFGVPGGDDIDAVLVSFLAALGVSRNKLPAERSERLARYRELIRRRSMLVILDNVGSSDDVIKLLPTGPGSLAIITSRQRLTTLTVRHSAVPIVLGPIDEPASVALLHRLSGGRVGRTSVVMRNIARACGGHPLALCLVGARIATRPEESLPPLAAALAEPGQRIPTLDRYAERGDAVADVFGWSHQSLADLPARVFRLLGLTPCASLDLPAAACLTGLPEDVLRPVLAELCAAHLLINDGRDGYGMLDLIAEYADALVTDIDGPDVRQAALDRLYAHHRDVARAAAHCLWPAEVPQRSGESFIDPAHARAWLDDHRDDLLAAARHPAGVARPEHVVDLAGSLFRYLDHGGFLDQATAINAEAVTAALALGDDVETARALGRLGAVLVRRGLSERAEVALRAAHEAYTRLGDARGQAVALGNLGRVATRRADFAEAATLQLAALELFRHAGDRLGEARTLTNLGIVWEARGDLAEALANLEAARVICGEFDAPDASARVLGSIAGILRAQNRLAEATDLYEEALRGFRALGDRLGEATTLTNLGLVLSQQGPHGDAGQLHEEALEIFNEIGDDDSAVETLNNLGSALLSAGRPAGALPRLREALRRAAEIGDRAEAARAHASLALAHAQQAGPSSDGPSSEWLALARQHLVEAFERYRDLGEQPPAPVLALEAQLESP